MLAKSFIVVLLSIPASFAVIGVILSLTPLAADYMMPWLLLVFPVWMGMVCGGYLIPKKSHAAVALIAVSIIGFGSIALLKYTGLATV